MTGEPCPLASPWNRPWSKRNRISIPAVKSSTIRARKIETSVLAPHHGGESAAGIDMERINYVGVALCNALQPEASPKMLDILC